MAEDKNKGKDQAARTRGAESGSAHSTAAGIGVRNKKSTAQGPYQFLDGTWKEMEKVAGRPLDKKNPQDHDIAFQLYTKRSEKVLAQNGIEVNPGNTYALHVFGPKGGVDYLKKMKSNPSGLATEGISSAVINGNKAFFYGKDGKPRTNLDSYSTLSQRVGGESDPGAITLAKEQQKQQYVIQKQAAVQQQQEEQQQAEVQAQEQAAPEQQQQPQEEAPLTETSPLSQVSNSQGIMYNGDRNNPGKFILPEMPQAPEGVATSGDASMKAKTFAFGGPFALQGPGDTIRPQKMPALTPAQQAYMMKREAQKAKNAARLAPIEASRQQWVDANPGKTMDDYWKWQKQRNRGADAGLDGMIGLGQSENKGSCSPGVNQKKSAASSGRVNYSFGGEIDPTKKITPAKVSKNAIGSSVSGVTGLSMTPENNNLNFNTKKIVNYQPGVMNDKMGSGFYLYSKRQSDPGFNVDRDREFVKQSEMGAVQRTPEWVSYMQGEAAKKAIQPKPVAIQYGDGGEINNGVLNDFNEGGSHEENPNGGIPQGIAPNGEMNTVEEGETKMGQYVFSDRLKLDKADVENLYLPKETAGMTYAEASKFINDFIEENPFDIIIKRTATGQLDSLKVGNDRARRFKEQEEDIVNGEDMNPEKIMKFSGSQQQTEEPTEEKMSPEVEAQQPQAGPAEKQYSFGGVIRKFKEGGDVETDGDGMFDKENIGKTVEGGVALLGSGLAMGMEAFKKHDVNNLNDRIGKTSAGAGAASGAMKMAAAGSALGPWGAAAGAVVGGALGFIGAGRQNRAANIQDMNISGNNYNKQFGASVRDSDESVISAYGGKQRQLKWGDDLYGPKEEGKNITPRYFMQDPYDSQEFIPGVPGAVGFGKSRFDNLAPNSLKSYSFNSQSNKKMFDSNKTASDFMKKTENTEKSFRNSRESLNNDIKGKDSYSFSKSSDFKDLTDKTKQTDISKRYEKPFQFKGTNNILGYAGAVGAVANYFNSKKEKPRVIKSEQYSKYSTPNYYDERILENKMNQEVNNRQQEILTNSGGSASAARAMSMAGNSEINKLKSDGYFKMEELNNGIRNADQAELQRVEDANVGIRNNDYQSNLAEQDYVQGRKEKARDNMYSSVEAFGQEQNDRNLIYNMSKGYLADGTYDPEGNKGMFSRAVSMAQDRVNRLRGKANGGLLAMHERMAEQTEEEKQIEYIKRKYNG